MSPLDLILLFALSLFFFAILIGLIILIYFGFKKSKEQKKPFAIIVISSSGSPLNNIDVKFGDEIATTDPYGKAQFEVQPGEYELLIIADGHSEFRQKIRVGESNVYTARLSRDSLYNETKQLEKAFSSVRREREEIGIGYNPTIPDYMLSICLAIHKMALDEVRVQPDKKLRSEILASATFAISQISKGLVERRNLTLYARAKGKKIRNLELPLLRSPDVLETKKKLTHVDMLLTKKTGKSAIYPPLVLWKAAQRLLANPSAFNIKLSAFILDSAEKMVLELEDYLS